MSRSISRSEFNRLVGQRIRTARKLRGLTQQQLALALGISFQQLQKYETGVNTLSLDRARHIGHILNIPMQDWGEEQMGHGLPSQVGHTRMELVLLQTYHRIRNENNRVLLCALAKALAGMPPTPEKN